MSSRDLSGDLENCNSAKRQCIFLWTDEHDETDEAGSLDDDIITFTYRDDPNRDILELPLPIRCIPIKLPKIKVDTTGHTQQIENYLEEIIIKTSPDLGKSFWSAGAA